MAGQLQAGGDKLAQPGRREKLAVFDFLFCLAELMVVFIISPFQPMEAAVPRIGVVDVLRSDAVFFRPAVCDQAEDFFIQCFSLVMGNRFPIIGILQSRSPP